MANEEWEKEVKPEESMASKPFRTTEPKKLNTMEPITGVAAYDPSIAASLYVDQKEEGFDIDFEVTPAGFRFTCIPKDLEEIIQAYVGPISGDNSKRMFVEKLVFDVIRWHQGRITYLSKFKPAGVKEGAPTAADYSITIEKEKTDGPSDATA